MKTEKLRFKNQKSKIKIKDLLFELGTEEIPARFMRGILDDFKLKAEKAFRENRIDFNDIETFGTCRRLVLYVTNVAERQKESQSEIKGPPEKIAIDKDRNYTQAAIGFAKKQGVNPKDLILKELDGTKYIFAVKKEEAKPTKNILPELLKNIVSTLYLPIAMRWEETDYQFIRPVHWILALYGQDLIKIEIAGIKSDTYTRGHRLLSLAKNLSKLDRYSLTSGQKIIIKNPKDYENLLKGAKVIVRDSTRKEGIKNEIIKLAEKIKAKPIIDEELLEEVTFLVEYPMPVIGTFHNDYLELPEEVLITTMKKNQKYFSLKGSKGKLVEKYIVVTNGYTNEKTKKVITNGCERVLVARLEDAHFFFSEDKRNHIENNLEKLKKVIYQEKLGSVYEKVQRMKKIAEWLIGRLCLDSTKDKILRTVELSKTDLVSHMVGEFPELQGVMGKYYAKYFKEDNEVIEGIYEHYLPRGQDDNLPKTCAGIIASIADKIDNIIGCFSIDLIPSGSQDPYALRRQAQGIISIINHWKLELSLTELIEKALEVFETGDKKGLKEKALDFFIQRLKNYLLEKGNKYDVVDAVLNVNYDNVLDAYSAVPELNKIYDESDFQGLVDTGVRVYRLSKDHKSTEINDALFKEEIEKDLYKLAKNAEESIYNFKGKRDYLNVIKELRKLIKPVDEYFVKVMVMADNEDLKNNRLSFLKYLDSIYKKVADFDKIAV